MTQPSGEPTPSEGWKAVAPEPSEGSTPPMPGWAKGALAGGVALLCLAAGLIGASLGSQSGAQQPPTVEESPTPTPAFELEAPVVVDDLVRGEVNESTGPPPLNQEIVQADYTDGEQTVVFVLTWPEPDIAEFLTNAGIEDPAETAVGSDTYCGVSEDTGESACGKVVDEVGVLLVSVSPQSESEVADILARFEEELGQ